MLIGETGMLTGTFDQQAAYPWYWNFTIFYSESEDRRQEVVLMEKWGKYPTFESMLDGMLNWIKLIKEKNLTTKGLIICELKERKEKRERAICVKESKGATNFYQGGLVLESADYKAKRRF